MGDGRSRSISTRYKAHTIPFFGAWYLKQRDEKNRPFSLSPDFNVGSATKFSIPDLNLASNICLGYAVQQAFEKMPGKLTELAVFGEDISGTVWVPYADIVSHASACAIIEPVFDSPVYNMRPGLLEYMTLANKDQITPDHRLLVSNIFSELGKLQKETTARAR